MRVTLEWIEAKNFLYSKNLTHVHIQRTVEIHALYQLEENVRGFGYTDLAIPGSSVTFGCLLPKHSLIGSNISTCMGGNLTQQRQSNAN